MAATVSQLAPITSHGRKMSLPCGERSWDLLPSALPRPPPPSRAGRGCPAQQGAGMSTSVLEVFPELVVGLPAGSYFHEALQRCCSIMHFLSFVIFVKKNLLFL